MSCLAVLEGAIQSAAAQRLAIVQLARKLP